MTDNEAIKITEFAKFLWDNGFFDNDGQTKFEHVLAAAYEYITTN